MSIAAVPTLSLARSEWLGFMTREYLDTYVRQGGSAVKVAVVAPDVAALTGAELLKEAAERGYITASIAAGTLKIHQVDRFYHQVAAAIPWRDLAERFMRSGLRSLQLEPGDRMSIQSIAARKDVDEGLIRDRIERLVTDSILKDHSLTRDFRIAMTHLCYAAVEPDDLRLERVEAIEAWLKGELLTLGALRPLSIFSKINRTNARDMFHATTAWIRNAGVPGLVVVTDIGEYALSRTRRLADGATLRPLHKAATLDAYEMVREFIDSTDEMASAFLLFLTGPEFLEDERRGVQTYDALRLRLVEDVRDRDRPNPLSPMVRISS